MCILEAPYARCATDTLTCSAAHPGPLPPARWAGRRGRTAWLILIWLARMQIHNALARQLATPKRRGRSFLECFENSWGHPPLQLQFAHPFDPAAEQLGEALVDPGSANHPRPPFSQAPRSGAAESFPFHDQKAVGQTAQIDPGPLAEPDPV